MNSLLLAGAATLALTAGVAMAQTAAAQTTTTVTPSIVAPPPDTLSVTRTERVIGLDGTRTDTKETTYRNSAGVADETVSKTITSPPMVSTTTTTNYRQTTTE